MPLLSGAVATASEKRKTGHVLARDPPRLLFIDSQVQRESRPLVLSRYPTGNEYPRLRPSCLMLRCACTSRFVANANRPIVVLGDSIGKYFESFLGRGRFAVVGVPGDSCIRS